MVKGTIKNDTNKFQSLPISTQTVMIYFNCLFNINNIHSILHVEKCSETDLKKVVGEHGKIYHVKDRDGVRGIPTKKKGNFRNQITLKIWIIDKLITVKIFPTGKLQLSGCKTSKHHEGTAIELIKHIKKYQEPDKECIILNTNEPLTAIIEVVMVNVDFFIGFDIELAKLDAILQTEDNAFYTIFDAPVTSNVNIKLDYDNPGTDKFRKITFSGDKTKLSYTNKCPKSRPKKMYKHTFLVFSTSKIIQSGRYYDTQMEAAYTKFMEFMNAHRKDIELVISDKKQDISDILKNRGSLNIKLK